MSLAKNTIITSDESHHISYLVFPVDDEDLENIILSRSPRLQALLDKSRQSIQEGEGLSEEEFWQVVEEKIASS